VNGTNVVNCPNAVDGTNVVNHPTVVNCPYKWANVLNFLAVVNDPNVVIKC
jgi:hypothetical protein